MHGGTSCNYALLHLTLYLSYDERNNKLIERLNALNNAVGADDDDEYDD